MGIRQIETAVFIEFLTSLGLVYIKHKASHYSFNYPPGQPQLDRPLIIRIKHKEMPILHIHTNLRTLGISHQDFEDWLKKPKRLRNSNE